MDTFGIEYVGLFIRYLYILIFKTQKISWKELSEKTKYGQNIGFIKTSNHNIGSLLAVIILITVIIIRL